MVTLLEAVQLKAACPMPAVATKPPGTGGTAKGDHPGTVTLSNVAAHKVLVSWLQSAKPTDAVAAMVNVAVPRCTHLAPSGEEYPVKVLPLRTSLIQ
jgi:hypothetical protein